MARGRPSMSDDMVKFSFSLPRELRDRFMERMRADDLPASSLLRHAIEAYLATPRPVFFGGVGVAPTDRPAPKPTPVHRREATASSPTPVSEPAEPSASPAGEKRQFEGIMALLEMANAPDAEQDAEKHD